MSTAYFIGVYSSLSSGSRTGRGSVKGKRYWFAWDCCDMGYRVQELDGAFQPQGEVLDIDPATLQASFSLEPSILAAPIRQGSFPVPPSPQQDGDL
ncbi:MAG: hypothetical protein FWG59_00295, partial [Betaproteobacteria bacterium]|nr:hypothetical protein [Betaproteobacteria bacterium]